METRLGEFQQALTGLDYLVCYALKANSNLAVIRTFAALGAGADVVSLGELRQALAAGVPAERIVFAGVGKTAEEMAPAIDAGIMMFNVESEPELRLLSQVAESKGATAAISVRVNPDVDAGTHEKISTGRRQDKFGIGWERAREIYDLAAELPGLKAEGVAVHIGSQLTSLGPFEAAFRRVAELATALRQAGHDIRHLDLGGGLGINYKDEAPPSPEAYADMVRRTVGGLGLQLVFEPGRYLVGNAGIILSRVIHIKDEGRRFVILDAAMNDLIRPALYEAWHDILPVAEPRPGESLAPATFAGPICETGDVLAHQRAAPLLAPDDLIAIGSAGAYAAVMASTYNSRPLAPEVLVKGDRFAVVRRRQSVEELVSRDSLPPWLDGTSGEDARGAA
jgi:diaminopimelate decarboxylase